MRRKREITVAGICLILSMLACSVPGVAAPAGSQGTPNMTMTALFGSGIFGTLTVVAPTAGLQTVTQAPTQVPSETPEAATNTPAPEASDTPEQLNTPTAPATLTPFSGTTPISGRPGPHVLANYFATPPTLDGTWDEWPQKPLPAASVVYGAGHWSGVDDLQASYKVGWDEQYLYVAVKVRDDRYVQRSSGANLYKGDSLEILLDTHLAGDYYTQALNSDDFQLGISAGNPDLGAAQEAYLWFPRSQEGEVSGVEIGTASEAGVYRVEEAIPWSVFGVTPSSGLRMGFGLSVSDNDSGDQNVQQTMISNLAGRMLTNPTTWGELILQ